MQQPPERRDDVRPLAIAQVWSSVIFLGKALMLASLIATLMYSLGLTL